jgi:hypothetical protein
MKSKETVIKPLMGRGRNIGLVGGSLWLIVISAVFVIWSLLVIGTPLARQILIIVIVIIAALVVTSIILIRRAHHLPEDTDQQKLITKVVIRRFVLVVIIEVIAFSVLNPIVAANRQFELMPSLNLIIVGIHFLPLAWIFRVPRYYLTGVLLCIIPMLTLLIIPKDYVIGFALAWYVVPSLGCGFIATITAMAGMREAWLSIINARATVI